MANPTHRPPVHPIGYVEFQTGWVGETSAEEHAQRLGDLRSKAAQEAPGLVETSMRVESVADGAGVIHNTLYVGFAPPVPAAPPLGNNMNNAPLPQPGFGPEPTDNAMPIGWKEQQFNRGT